MISVKSAKFGAWTITAIYCETGELNPKVRAYPKRITVAVTESIPPSGFLYFPEGKGAVMMRDAIQKLARKNRQKPRNLLALAQFNDPFYIGSQTQLKHAEWAAELYRLMNPRKKVHDTIGCLPSAQAQISALHLGTDRLKCGQWAIKWTKSKSGETKCD